MANDCCPLTCILSDIISSNDPVDHVNNILSCLNVRISKQLRSYVAGAVVLNSMFNIEGS
jgi:hypothetical protein